MSPRVWPSYAAIRRWHFYAGLLCIPFVLWLATTGSIYLFRPQIEQLIDAPYANVANGGSPAAPAAQVEAALKAVPGSVLHKYQLPGSSKQAVQIIVGSGPRETRVYVNPMSLRVLKVVNEDERLMPTVFRLHGELLMGNKGSYIVELAASWTILMILSGLFLWWPRGTKLAGILWPRLRSSSRWRDLHAVTGFWVSAFALAFLFSGLPWAKSWGDYLAAVRSVAASSPTAHLWTPAGTDAVRVREVEDRNTRAALAVALRPDAGSMAGMAGMADISTPGETAHPISDYSSVDRVVAAARPLGLAAPVLIVPPAVVGGPWSAMSDTQNRPLQSSVKVDGASGKVLSRENFADRQLIDRIVGYEIAAHEGQLFGEINQVLNLFVALGMMLLSVSSVVLWWRRRPAGVLGAPPFRSVPPLAWTFVASIALLAILLPLFGASIIVVLLVERCILRRLERSARWLGLSTGR